MCSAKGLKLVWVRNRGWMFCVKWRSKSQVFLRDPTFNPALGLPTANEKQAACAEQRSRPPANASVLMAGVALWRTPLVCFGAPWAVNPGGALARLTSKTNPSRWVHRVHRRSDDGGKRENIPCTWKSMCSTNRHTWCWWHNCGEHNCRHNQVHISSAGDGRAQR